MEKKKSGFSGVITIIFAVVVLIRIVMIMGRNSSNSAHQTWDNTYLIWSIILFVFLIGSFFWSRMKKDSGEE